MRLPRRFQWLAADDSERTHLDLIKGEVYSCASVSTSLLVQWAKDGLLTFVTDDDNEDLPPETVLEVHNISISMKTVIADKLKVAEAEEK